MCRGECGRPARARSQIGDRERVLFFDDHCCGSLRRWPGASRLPDWQPNARTATSGPRTLAVPPDPLRCRSDDAMRDGGLEPLWSRMDATSVTGAGDGAAGCWGRRRRRPARQWLRVHAIDHDGRPNACRTCPSVLCRRIPRCRSGRRRDEGCVAAIHLGAYPAPTVADELSSTHTLAPSPCLRCIAARSKRVASPCHESA